MCTHVCAHVPEWACSLSMAFSRGPHRPKELPVALLMLHASEPSAPRPREPFPTKSQALRVRALETHSPHSPQLAHVCHVMWSSQQSSKIWGKHPISELAHLSKNSFCELFGGGKTFPMEGKESMETLPGQPTKARSELRLESVSMEGPLPHCYRGW